MKKIEIGHDDAQITAEEPKTINTIGQLITKSKTPDNGTGKQRMERA